ncbi:hypothetical protein DBV15_12746 [Temnothorax longispinosus]|uniref:THAP-type domain-containing protein n=1 Tax=Temnothorax longispinosus TaxID=300112 RepID=A0A4S2JNB5_9HYME|nr:hypothetical protein DBV15_12746 [Temnothorax longispinosus]
MVWYIYQSCYRWLLLVLVRFGTLWLLIPESRKKSPKVKKEVPFVHNINMVVRCCIKTCKRNNKDDKEHSFFSFPSDLKITQKWLEFLGTKNVSGYQRICSDHFEEKCFKKIYPRRLLRNDAIPTINIRNLSPSENRLEEDVISNNYDIEQEQSSNEITADANHRVETPIDILMTSDMIQITSKNIDRIIIFTKDGKKHQYWFNK